MPLMAMEPGNSRSFFGRCYSWVSSSFFVTRDFVKREFNEIGNRFSGFTAQTLEAQGKINNLERTLESIQDSQRIHGQTFATVTQSNNAQLKSVQEKLIAHKEEEEKLAKRVNENAALAQARERDIIASHAVVVAARNAVDKQRKEIEEQDTQLLSEHKNNNTLVRAHYTQQNERFDSALALLEANRRNLVRLGSELNEAIAASKQRLEKQTITAERLAKLEKQASEYQKKSNGLKTAWFEFKKKQAGMYFPSMFAVPIVPFGPSTLYLESRSNENSAAASASSSSSNIYIEEID